MENISHRRIDYCKGTDGNQRQQRIYGWIVRLFALICSIARSTSWRRSRGGWPTYITTIRLTSFTKGLLAHPVYRCSSTIPRYVVINRCLLQNSVSWALFLLIDHASFNQDDTFQLLHYLEQLTVFSRGNSAYFKSIQQYIQNARSDALSDTEQDLADIIDTFYETVRFGLTRMLAHEFLVWTAK